jgi:brefeldin A-resistance guanine nucleotide exchange factor 1
MSSSGYLVPPSQDSSHEKLWTETWKRLDRFLPDLRKELSMEDRVEPDMVSSEELPATDAPSS